MIRVIELTGSPERQFGEIFGKMNSHSLAKKSVTYLSSVTYNFWADQLIAQAVLLVTYSYDSKLKRSR